MLTAELYGLAMAVEYINKKRFSETVIFSDSQSALSAIRSFKRVQNPLVIELRHTVLKAQKQPLAIEFCWVPSHIGISGNEDADRAAATSADRAVIIDIPVADYRKLWKQIVKK